MGVGWVYGGGEVVGPVYTGRFGVAVVNYVVYVAWGGELSM